MSAHWFPDNTVLCNFAAVDRLDLLRAVLDGRGRWTEAVAYEAGRSTRFITAMSTIARDGWLGAPIAVSAEQAARIERIRIARLGGDRDRPLEHRGEAETCYVIREVVRDNDSVWITDDEAAYDFGRQLGIITRDTRDIAEYLVTDGLLGPVDAFNLLVAMVDADRTPRRPPRSPQA